MRIALLSLLLAVPLLGAVRDVETVTTDDDHYDKFASIAVDRAGAMWVAYTSMHDDRDEVILRAKSEGRWSGELRVDGGEGFEANPKLLVDRDGSLWVFWHGRRGGKWSVFARRRLRGRWSPESKISPATKNALRPAVALDRSGTIWMAYEVSEGGTFHIEVLRNSGNGWIAAKAPSAGGVDRRP
jgi:hypothetical protein